MANGFDEDRDPNAPGPGEVEDARKLLAMMSAMRDVRTLDDWMDATRARWEMRQIGTEWYVALFRSGQLLDFCDDVFSTPDEARAKAAAWVREQGREAQGKEGR